MDTMISVMKAASDRNRIRILKMLQHKNMCVCELASVLDIKQPSVSRHLKKLKDAGIIASKKDGFWTVYFIDAANPFAEDIVTGVMKQLNDDPQVQEDLHKAEKTERSVLCCSLEKAEQK
jgi:ArsR family transcriptional regulator